MKYAKLVAMGCAVALATAGLTGCTKTTDNTETSEVAESESVTAQVTAVDGNTITADLGEMAQMQAAEKPDGEAPSGEAPSGEAPAKPDGDSTDGQAPSMFTASGESITFTLTDDTQIIVEQGGETTDGTADDIQEGSILELTLDADNNALTVVVKNAGGPGGAPGQSSDASNGTAATTIDSDITVDGETYSSTGDDENALRVDGATATLTNITVNKTEGSSSSADNGDFYGMNAGLLAQNGATVTIQNATVNTSVKNGNGVFSYGTGTTVNISNSTIRTTGDCSGGIQTTGGGTTNASNLDVETQGNSSAAIRSDRGGGTVHVDGGTYVTNGTGSPAVYSTADITVSDATLTANNSEGVVVEGKNSVSLTDCDLTGNMTGTYQDDSENIHNIMIYQSMSGDAEVGEASFTGCINPDGAEGTVDVTLSDDSTWTLTGDSYVSSFTGSTSNITANGYHLYVDGEQVL